MTIDGKGGEELKTYLESLKNGSTYHSSGEFTEDITEKAALAMKEAKTAEGALSKPGFALIRTALDPITKRLDEIEELHAADLNYDPKMLSQFLPDDLRQYATEWAELLGALVPKMNRSLRESKIPLESTQIIDASDSEGYKILEPHINQGLWLASQSDRLISLRAEAKKGWQLPQWLTGKKSDAPESEQYVAKVVRASKKCRQYIEVLKAAIREPTLDKFATRGIEFPRLRRLEFNHGGKDAGVLIGELEEQGLIRKTDIETIDFINSPEFEMAREKNVTLQPEQFVILEKDTDLDQDGAIIDDFYKWEVGSYVLSNSARLGLKPNLPPNIAADLLLSPAFKNLYANKIIHVPTSPYSRVDRSMGAGFKIFYDKNLQRNQLAWESKNMPMNAGHHMLFGLKT